MLFSDHLSLSQVFIKNELGGKPIEYLRVVVGKFYMVFLQQLQIPLVVGELLVPVVSHYRLHEFENVTSLSLDVDVEDGRVESSENKSDDTGSCIDACECRFVSAGLKVEELEAASQADSEVLVENERVEEEHWPASEDNSKMPEEYMLTVLFDILEQAMKNDEDKCQDSEGHSHIINVPEKRDVLVVMLVLRRSIVV